MIKLIAEYSNESLTNFRTNTGEDLPKSFEVFLDYDEDLEKHVVVFVDDRIVVNNKSLKLTNGNVTEDSLKGL